MKDKHTLLGKKLKFFRTRKAMSQTDLEVSTDLSFGSISRIESGKTEPTKETIFKIADALNGQKVRMLYSAEYIATNPRFVIIEYEPTNFVYKLLSKIL